MKCDTFCALNYGIVFRMFQKVNVRAEQAHPLFTYLASSLSLEGFDKCIRLPKYLFLMIRFGQNKNELFVIMYENSVP